MLEADGRKRAWQPQPIPPDDGMARRESQLLLAVTRMRELPYFAPWSLQCAIDCFLLLWQGETQASKQANKETNVHISEQGRCLQNKNLLQIVNTILGAPGVDYIATEIG